MFLKRFLKIKLRFFSSFALGKIDLYIYSVQLLETIEKSCLSPNIACTTTSSGNHHALPQHLLFMWFILWEHLFM